MTDATFHCTKQDVRKYESRIARQYDGKTPATSDISNLKSVIDRNTDKSKEIDEHKANLPLPDQPPPPGDMMSSNIRTMDVGSGRVEGPISGENNSALRQPATATSSVRESGEEWKKHAEPGPGVGRQGKDNLEDLPKDAKAQ